MKDRQLADVVRVDSYLTVLIRTSKTPGIQYLVVSAADVVFEYANGWAVIDRQAPIDLETTLMAYSMSKTITAVAVLQLVEAGSVRLDDPVERYVDSLPYEHTVTL